jgi:hypothetical protein
MDSSRIQLSLRVSFRQVSTVFRPSLEAESLWLVAGL